MAKSFLQVSAMLLVFSFGQACLTYPAHAQRSKGSIDNDPHDEHSQWYYGGQEKPTKSIAQQKAELKAEQRMDRLASLKWYGFTPGRPTAATMPFTTMYSPAWTRPGGQPFAWYTGYPQPIVYRYPYDHWYW